MRGLVWVELYRGLVDDSKIGRGCLQLFFFLKGGR